MRIFLCCLAGVAALYGAAAAHPGSNLLITDSKAAARAMSDGVSFEESNGVHLFKGRARTSMQTEETALLGGEPVASAKNCNIEIEIRERPWRRLRQLRTQGFYSGVPYRSRPYTQGFYSGVR
ncbi:hypothetical protein ACFOOP_06080 [Marinicaulis aureus]|uniref:Uncharacterized protein n=1 Tax=Hyphococcus aureus TaxID=2666033 RepID=A0ABW1KS08_9PROT